MLFTQAPIPRPTPCPGPGACRQPSTFPTCWATAGLGALPPLYHSISKKGPPSFSTLVHLSHQALKTAGVRRCGVGWLAGSQIPLSPTASYTQLPNKRLWGGRGGASLVSFSTPLAPPPAAEGTRHAWPFERLSWGGVSERGTLREDEHEPLGGRREEEGWPHVTSPSPHMEGGAATRRKAAAVQPPNKGAIHSLPSYLLCTSILCWGRSLLPRHQGPPPAKSHSWMVTPSNQRGAPQPVLGTQVT